MTTTARLLGARLVGVVVLAAAFLVVSGRASDTGLAAAEAVRCPGNNTEQQAPFSCTATKVIADIGFTAVVDVDSDGTRGGRRLDVSDTDRSRGRGRP